MYFQTLLEEEETSQLETERERKDILVMNLSMKEVSTQYKRCEWERHQDIMESHWK